MKKIKITLLSLLSLSPLFFISCGDDDSLTTEQQLVKDIIKIEAYIAEKGIQNAEKTATGLHYAITTAGSGSNASVGSNVTVHYTGKFLSDGVFDSSAGKNPLQFQLGVGRVILGWDEGLQHFNEGSKGVLMIPSVLAYGTSGVGSIGPDEVLVFEVEMVAIN